MKATAVDVRTCIGSRVSRSLGRNRQLLRGSPHEVLARIADGDPLKLAERVAQHLRRERLLMDEHRVLLRSLAFIARSSASYRGRPGLPRWLDQQLALAIGDLRAGSAGGSAGARWSQLALRFGLSTTDLDRACVRFHRLPFEARDSFFALVLDGRPVESLIHPGGRSAVEYARDARRALAIFLGLKSPCNPLEVR